MIHFQRSWARAWNGCGAQGDGGELGSALLARYSEPHRRYHTLQHLAECLAHFEAVQALPPHAAEVELALWFHDAIYDVRRQDNEKLSAEWARHSLAGAGASSETAQRVSDLVMATRHSVGAPVAMDAQVVVDVDLAILGASPERFAEYESQVREEFAHVPIWTFRWKRAEILQSFLDRPRIYSTPHFFERYEAPARENIERAIGSP